MTRFKNAGFSLLELLIVLAILFVIVLIAQPICTMGGSGRSANGASAMHLLRNLHTAQTDYALGKGKGNFTKDIDALKPLFFPSSGIENSVVYAQPASFFRKNYAFGPIKVTPATSTSPARFSCIARPVNTKGRKRTGNDTFFIDETGIIRHSGSPTVWPDENSEPVR
ncbi:MAG: type II secretion system GspH family protein [Blastocatellia bacterium]|nr:type II secretion system GspH family protein [Blastocatellia bacterium]